jgi:Zn-dependent peptidase ImmA (M78 family)
VARRADVAAARLLAEHRVLSPPVNVEAIATAAGALVIHRPFENGDVSGMLFRSGRQDIIGVNSTHGQERQRFTIAHELGHRALHPGRELILDVPVRVNFRDRTSSQATDREEIEANAFAAALLMPDQMVRDELDRLPVHLRRDPSHSAFALADVFSVSVQALSFRLINLGLMT